MNTNATTEIATPTGPWNPIQAPQDCGAYWWIQSTTDIEGCRDLATLSRHFSTEANARLMASAPVMLEALQNAEKRIVELCRMVCSLANDPKKVRAEDWTDKTRAAIAAATGE